MRFANRLLNGNQPATGSVSPTAPSTDTAAPPPTNTSVPTATIALTPTPDLSVIGLPQEQAGTTAFDFAADICGAEWFNRREDVPCPGDEAHSQAGYAMRLSGEIQGLPPNLTMLLMYPPQDNYSTLFSKYPAFTVKKGDRFRAVLACRAHTFCDMVFALEYYDEHGKAGLKHWPYKFTDAPLVIDYPLDGIAGKTVQFGLALTGIGNRLEAYGVWIVPHIYRPTP